jgi:hypothetical protein
LLKRNRKNKNIRGQNTAINEFKNGYKPRSNLVRDENDHHACRFPEYFEWVEELLLSEIQCTLCATKTKHLKFSKSESGSDVSLQLAS